MLGMQPKRAAAVIRKTAKKFLRVRPDKDIRLVLVLEGKQDPVLVFFEEVRTLHSNSQKTYAYSAN
jgi:hypothetical protein